MTRKMLLEAATRAPYNPGIITRKLRNLRIPHNFVMTVRQKKFIGTILLLILVVVWSLVAMALAQAPIIAASYGLQVAFYVIVGVGWVLPAMPLIKWMTGPKVLQP